MTVRAVTTQEFIIWAFSKGFRAFGCPEALYPEPLMLLIGTQDKFD
jgi:hypothetical protein